MLTSWDDGEIDISLQPEDYDSDVVAGATPHGFFGQVPRNLSFAAGHGGPDHGPVGVRMPRRVLGYAVLHNAVKWDPATEGRSLTESSKRTSHDSVDVSDRLL
mmetsp:Transcript_53995/g.73770  ORF Transcript_53995/g.73770 Transcript_53995/m.73770 type:complete len:103 (+) Transcript_53995:256-564(+)